MTGCTDTARLIFELVRRRRGADPFVLRAKTALASDDIGSKSPRCGHGGLSSLDDPLTTRRFYGDGIGWRPGHGMQPVWAQARTCPASHECHAACNSWIEAVTVVRETAPRLGAAAGFCAANRVPVEQNHRLAVLDLDERDTVWQRCGGLATHYGDAIGAEPAR